MAKKKINISKRPGKNSQLLNEDQKASAEPYGTQWPSTIGSKRNPGDDGKIRDSAGTVMG